MNRAADAKVCTLCHRAAAVREWRWNGYHCPECTQYDAVFARTDQETDRCTLSKTSSASS